MLNVTTSSLGKGQYPQWTIKIVNDISLLDSPELLQNLVTNCRNKARTAKHKTGLSLL